MDFSDLARLTGGYADARAIQAAVELGVFDALEKSRDAGGAASELKCDSRATELLLDALVAIGLVHKNGPLYSLDEIAATYLLKNSPKYLGGMILFESSSWRSWEKLAESVRSGKPARPADMYQSESDETARFITAMDSLVRARGDAEIVAHYLDVSGVENLLDVGSGPATYPIYLCCKHTSLRATIFDLPATLKITEKFVRGAGLRDRIRLIAGDYRTDKIPGRYELAFLSNVIHGEGSEENGRLMAKLHNCLVDTGRIVVKDHILDDSHARPAAGAVFALLMLLTTERGKCYSYKEVTSWLEAAGFTGIHELPLPPPLTSSLVIGRK